LDPGALEEDLWHPAAAARWTTSQLDTHQVAEEPRGWEARGPRGLCGE